MHSHDSHTKNTPMKINKDINDFTGDSLMIGCGHTQNHYFSFASQPVSATSLHPSALFYHVSLISPEDKEGMHDLEGDFLKKEVIAYLTKKKFNLICFEAVTDITSSKKNTNQALKNAKKILADTGICFILGGIGQHTLEIALEKFNYSYSFTYGLNDAWSLVASDKDFDLLKLLESNDYLNYMANHVILKKSNLSFSYNFKEKALDKIIRSSVASDLESLESINPFAKNKCNKINEEFARLLPEEQDIPHLPGYGSQDK